MTVPNGNGAGAPVSGPTRFEYEHYVHVYGMKAGMDPSPRRRGLGLALLPSEISTRKPRR